MLVALIILILLILLITLVILVTLSINIIIALAVSSLSSWFPTMAYYHSRHRQPLQPPASRAREKSVDRASSGAARKAKIEEKEGEMKESETTLEELLKSLQDRRRLSAMGDLPRWLRGS